MWNFRLLFLYFSLFNTVDSKQMFTGFEHLWCRKWPLCHLNGSQLFWCIKRLLINKILILIWAKLLQKLIWQKVFFVLNEAQKLFKDLKVKLDQSWLSCRRQNIAKTFDGNVLFFSEVQSMFSPSLGRQNDAHSM